MAKPTKQELKNNTPISVVESTNVYLNPKIQIDYLNTRIGKKDFAKRLLHPVSALLHNLAQNSSTLRIFLIFQRPSNSERIRLNYFHWLNSY